MTLLLLLSGGGTSSLVDGSMTSTTGTGGSMSGASFPTVATPVPFVEAAFGYGALTDPASAVWTDITAYVLSVNIQRGRQTELDAFSPGTCTIELDNHDRRFDPENAAGPYYGNLNANVPIRVTATISGVAYPRFYGFVNGWPQTFSPPKWSTVQVTATDGFKLLAQSRLPESVWAADIAKLLKPKVWLRLGETGEVAADVSGNGYDGVYMQQGSQGPAPSTSEPHVSSSYVAEGTGLAQVPNSSALIRNRSTDDWFVSVLVQADPGVLESGTLIAQNNGEAISITGAGAFEIHFGEGVIVYNTTDSSGGFATFVPTGTVGSDIGGLHWILIGGSSVGAQYIYFNGISQTNILSTGVSSFPFDTAAVWVGGEPSGWGFFRPSTKLSVMDVVLGQPNVLGQNPLLVPQDIQTMWLELLQPWLYDSTGTRIGRILDLAGWPAAQRSIELGESTLDIAVLGRRAPLDYMQQVEISEQGRLFIDKSGRVVFHQRDHDLTNIRGTTAQAIFSDDGDDIEYEAQGFELTRDDRYVYREVTGSRQGGSAITVSDPTLSATDPVQTKDLSNLMVRTDGEVRNIVESFLQRYKTSKTRPSSWTVRPLDNSSKWQTVLNLEIADRVTLQATPMTAGAQYSSDFHIESINETWQASTAETVVSFTGSPVDANSYFRWDVSTWNGTDVWR